MALTIHSKSDSDAISVNEARNALAEFYQTAEFRKSPADAVELADDQIERATHEVGILVRRDQLMSVGFMHRSLQEFLAAKQLQTRPVSDLHEFFRTKSGEQGWHEVLLSALYLLKRNDEVDALLHVVRAETSDSFGFPLRQILLARAVFGDLNCSAGMAEEIAHEILSLVEASAWWPLRRALVEEVVRGLESEVLGTMVCSKLRGWFLCRYAFWLDLCRPLASNPGPRTAERLWVALFNNSHAGKEIAEAIGLGARHWPNLEERLHKLLLMPADQSLLSRALRALSLGWPNHPDLTDLLARFSEFKGDYLRAVALIVRAKRGDTRQEVKDALSAFCTEEGRIYSHEDEIIQTLSDCWATDETLRERALRAGNGYGGPGEWNSRIAVKFLMRACPGDDEAAKVLAKAMDPTRGVIPFDIEDWSFLVKNFAGHRLLVPVAEAWIDADANKHGYKIAEVAMLGRSHRCVDFLLEGLRTGTTVMGWSVRALLDIVGPTHSEFRALIASLVEDRKNASDLARHFPKLIEDSSDCEKRLLDLVAHGNPAEIGSALDGLEAMNRLKSEEALRIAEERLKMDELGQFWVAARRYLVTAFPQHQIVRERTLRELQTDTDNWHISKYARPMRLILQFAS